MACVVAQGPASLRLPRLEEARSLFQRHLPCEGPELRRVYLRLALQYHPDKRREAERREATELFQAIAAAYEELLRGSGASDAPQRVKSPVAAAAELGDLEELQRLLREDPDAAIEPDDLGVFPIMFAAVGGCVAAAALLLDFGADVRRPNPINWPPVLYAALGNHGAMVRFLADRGAVVGAHELVLAAYTGNPEGLEALLDRCETPAGEVRSEQSGKTLLHLACEGLCFLRHGAERHLACVELLLERRAPVDEPAPKGGRTCLQDLLADVRWRTRGFEHSAPHLLAVERLCAAGASVTAEDGEGGSALSIAKEAGLGKVRQLLFAFS